MTKIIAVTESTIKRYFFMYKYVVALQSGLKLGIWPAPGFRCWYFVLSWSRRQSYKINSVIECHHVQFLLSGWAIRQSISIYCIDAFKIAIMDFIKDELSHFCSTKFLYRIDSGWPSSLSSSSSSCLTRKEGIAVVDCVTILFLSLKCRK